MFAVLLAVPQAQLAASGQASDHSAANRPAQAARPSDAAASGTGAAAVPAGSSAQPALIALMRHATIKRRI